MGAFSQRGWARPSHPHSISLARGRTLALTRSRTLSLPPRTRSQEYFFPLTRYLEILKWCHVGCYADRYSFTHRFRVTWVVTQTATRSLIALNPLGACSDDPESSSVSRLISVLHRIWQRYQDISSDFVYPLNHTPADTLQDVESILV